MQRKHVISLCILLCALAVLVAFRPSADETMPLTGSASAGLILLDGQSEGFYVLAVIDQSRADRHRGGRHAAHPEQPVPR